MTQATLGQPVEEKPWRTTLTRNSPFSSLGARLSLIILVALLPAIIVIGWVNVTSQQEARRQAQQELLRLTQLVAKTQEMNLAHTRDILAGIAQFPEVRSGTMPACMERLAAMVQLYPQHAGFGVSNLAGEMFCPSQPLSTTVQVTDRLWFQRAITTGEFAIGEFQHSRPSNIPALGVGYPVRNDVGQVVGVVATSLTLTFLNRSITTTPLPEDAVLAVVDHRGTLIAQWPQPESSIGAALPDGPIRQAILAQQTGITEAIDIAGVDRVFAYMPLTGPGNTPVYLLIGRPSTALYAAADGALARNLALTIILLALALAATWLGSQRLILQPVYHLLRSTELLAAGNLHTRTDFVSDRGELGQLAVAFDGMAEALQQREAERKAAEEKLRASEVRLQHLIDAIPQIVWQADEHGVAIYLNQRWLTYTGLSVEQSLRDANGAIHPDDQAEAVRVWQEVRTLGEPYEYELRLRRADGLYRWHLARCVPIYDSANQLVAWFGTSTDIEDRKQAEIQQRFIIQLSTTISLLGDPDLIEQSVIQALGQHLGAASCNFSEIDLDADQVIIRHLWRESKAADIVGNHTLSKFVLPSFIEQAKHGETLMIHDVTSDPRTVTAGYEQVGVYACCLVPYAEEGQWRAVLSVNFGEPHHWRHGEITLVETVAARFWPLVIKARTEAALRVKEEQLRLVTENVPGLIAYIDRQERYQFVNAAYEHWYNRPRTQIIGHRLSEFIREQSYDHAQPYIAAALTGQSVSFELETSRTGQRVDWLLKYTPDRAADGEVVGFFTLITDITQRKQAERNQQFLLDLDAHTRLLDDADAILTTAAAHVGQYLDVAHCAFKELDAEAQQGVVLTDWRRRDTLPPLRDFHVLLATVGTAITQTLSAGQSVVVNDITQDPRTTAQATDYARVGVQSIARVPLKLKGALLAVLSVADDHPRSWQPQEIRLLEEVLAHIWPLVVKVRAEAALRANERFLQSIADTMPSLLYLYDIVAQRNIYANRQVGEILGYTPAEVQALGPKLMPTLLHPDDGTLVAENLAKLSTLADGETVTLEYRMQHKNEQWRWLSGTETVFARAGDGRVQTVLGVVQDITERKAMEEALRARERELRVITDNIPGLIAYIDRDECYRFVNATYSTWFGRPQAAIVGATLRQITGARYHVIQPYVMRALQGELVYYEETFTFADATRTVWVTYLPNQDDQGIVHGFYALVTDISERKAAEAALRESEERFRPLTNSAPVLIWVNGTDGGCDFVNQAYLNFFGKTLPEVQGFGWQPYAHPDDATAYVNAYLTAFEARSPFRAQARFLNAAGEYCWLDSVGLPRYSATGEFLGYVGSSMDITPLKQAEAMLRQVNTTLEARVAERTHQLAEKNMELERSNKELEKFAYVASHDLRSPLRAIDNLSKWIEEDAGHLLPAPSKEHLMKMRGRVRRMDTLLDDLLAYSRIGRFHYNQELIDGKHLLQNIIALLNVPATFQVTMAEPLPVFRAQRVLLELVLRNLMGNAIKHHHRPDGCVHVIT